VAEQAAEHMARYVATKWPASGKSLEKLVDTLGLLHYRGLEIHQQSIISLEILESHFF